MNQKTSAFSGSNLIYIVPFLVVLWGMYLYLNTLPFYVKGCDPEYPYLINGLNCALFHFGQIGHTDHPGTPFQLYNGIIIRITHLFAGKGGIDVDVLTRPEFYLGAISISLTLLAALLVLLIGKIGIKSHKIAYVVLLQATLFYQPVLLDLFQRCNPDRFLEIVTLLFIIVLLKFRFTEKPNQLKLAIWLGVVMGLGFATKINYLPLLIFSLFLLDKWKYRRIYAGVGLLSFALFISPIWGKFQGFKRFIFGIISHDGLYGSGDSRIFNLERILDNTKAIFDSNPELLIIIVFLVLAFIAIVRKPDMRKEGLPFIVGYLVLILVQILIVAKHYKNYYLAPLFTTYGLFLFGTFFFLEKVKYLGKITTAIKYCLPIILLVLSSPQILSVNNSARIKSENYQLEAAQFVLDSIDRDDYWFVEPTWESGPQLENALVYGFSFCADRVNYENVLNQLYPYVITSVENSNLVRFWHSSFAPLDTVIVSGKRIYVLSTPGRHAESLINVVNDEAGQLNIPVALDTVFKQPATQTYIIAIEPETNSAQFDSIQNQIRLKYTGKQTEFERKVAYYTNEIKNTPEWLANVKDKAIEKGISLDSMIYLDAVYMAERN